MKYALLSGMEKDKSDDKIIHNFDEKTSRPKMNNFKTLFKGPAVLFIVLGFLGIATGYIVAQTTGTPAVTVAPGTQGAGEDVETGAIFGSEDEETFNDSAEGTMRDGGIDGEGAYHLERPGGESQNVYLTSSVIDLSAFIGKKVKVWGETFDSEKAGWLMDVGRLQVL